MRRIESKIGYVVGSRKIVNNNSQKSKKRLDKILIIFYKQSKTNKLASKGDDTDFRALLKHREHAKNKQDADGMEKVDLRHGLCLTNIIN